MAKEVRTKATFNTLQLMELAHLLVTVEETYDNLDSIDEVAAYCMDFPEFVESYDMTDDAKQLAIEASQSLAMNRIKDIYGAWIREWNHG